MKSIVVSSLVTATLFAVGSIVVLVWWYSHAPLFKEPLQNNIEVIRTTADIERLRGYTLLLLQERKTTAKNSNDLMNACINLVAILGLNCVLLSLSGLAKAYMARNMALGRPIKWWLRWL